MPIFLADLSTGGVDHDYSLFWQLMRDIGAQRCFDASWLLDTKQDLATVTDTLLRHCAEGDGLFVVELSSLTRWSGTGLSIEAKAWIAERTVRGRLVAKPP